MVVHPHLKLTYDDYVLFPDDGRRRELIDGKIYVSPPPNKLYVTPSPNTRHQDVVGLVFRRLGNHLEAHGGGRVFIAPFDVILSEIDVVQPDVVFVSDANTRVITKTNIRGVPTLVVEVVSNRRFDRRIKRALYALHGVPEYWMIDPNLDQVEVYSIADVYAEPNTFEPGDTLTTDTVPGLALDLSDLLKR